MFGESGFNPRTRVGCDRRNVLIPCETRQFQSTHPRGVRHESRARYASEVKVSIHAPAWGATRYAAAREKQFNVSIHAPAWGATCLLKIWISKFLFQSTHPRGVRLELPDREVLSTEFQSTHPRGVRPAKSSQEGAAQKFQSTHPRGVRLITFFSLLRMMMFQSTHPRGVRLHIHKMYEY